VLTNLRAFVSRRTMWCSIETDQVTQSIIYMYIYIYMYICIYSYTYIYIHKL